MALKLTARRNKASTSHQFSGHAAKPAEKANKCFLREPESSWKSKMPLTALMKKHSDGEVMEKTKINNKQTNTNPTTNPKHSHKPVLNTESCQHLLSSKGVSVPASTCLWVCLRHNKQRKKEKNTHKKKVPKYTKKPKQNNYIKETKRYPNWNCFSPILFLATIASFWGYCQCSAFAVVTNELCTPRGKLRTLTKALLGLHNTWLFSVLYPLSKTAPSQNENSAESLIAFIFQSNR